MFELPRISTVSRGVSQYEVTFDQHVSASDKKIVHLNCIVNWRDKASLSEQESNRVRLKGEVDLTVRSTHTL